MTDIAEQYGVNAPLPDIGTPEREEREQWAIEFADQMLAYHEDMDKALGALRGKLNFSVAGVELAKHVQQVWIGRILQ